MTTLTIGTKLEQADSPVHLTAERFNRHTFWCGQSGSGKTYSLGVLLEQLLLETDLPLLILDPNADFSRLNQTRQGADPVAAQRIADADIEVLHSTRGDGARLYARFLGLSTSSKAAILQLDPIADADEFNVLLRADELEASRDAAAYMAGLRNSGDPGKARLATRIENLQVLQWELWARGATDVTEVVDRRPRATVLDLGGFTHPAEPKVAALAILEHLWAHREERRPILIVIDEAHNLCPPDPATPVELAVTQQLIQIAAEGRKFGLWLLLSTQRPTKIHPNVLSQCDNLGLMRMNAPRDLAELADVFGFVPGELLARAQQFAQGQALFAGGFIPEPTLVQMGARITHEGGADVGVPLSTAGVKSG
jgi:DNA helicase HerA-like ATPase